MIRQIWYKFLLSIYRKDFEAIKDYMSRKGICFNDLDMYDRLEYVQAEAKVREYEAKIND